MHNVTAGDAAIPALGFGTWQLEPADAEAMVAHAIEVGYRHIDTAQMYKNEQAVGRGIKKTGLAREDIFLTTKVWTDYFKMGDLQSSVADSLERLDTDYVDLILLHWPNPAVPLKETLDALNDVRARGLARHIGISNFPSALVREAVEFSAGPLAVNQVEYHPYLSQKPVLDTLAAENMALTAYCPLAQGQVFADDTLIHIGERHGKNAGQVALRWLVQQDGVIAIPRSSNPDHVAANFEIFDFELSAEEMGTLNQLQREDRRVVNPSFAPQWDHATQ